MGESVTTRVEKQFRWRAMDGRVYKLADMETSHVFNSMKMIFNHLAEIYGARPIWFTKRYSTTEGYFADIRVDPKPLASTVGMFVREIERRGDLPQRYLQPYREILEQIVKSPRLIEDTNRLPSPKKRPETQRERDLREDGFHVDFMGNMESDSPFIGTFQEVPNMGIIHEDDMFEEDY
jgi:hypothetical protein